MVSFGEKELDAIALIEPFNEDNSVNPERSQTSRAYGSLVISTLKMPIKWLRIFVNSYRRSRDLNTAKFKLYGMSNLELQDIGLRRCDIYHAVERKAETRNAKKSGFIKSAMKRLLEARKAHETYVQLTMMDNRQLNDIGLTRGDLQAFEIGMIGDFANSNQVRSINNKDHRRAG